MQWITSEKRDFFNKNGYVLLEQVVPADLCGRVIDELWRFLERDRSDPENWYGFPREYVQSVGGIEKYHGQPMWDVRQHPNVYDAFSELHDTEKLYVSVDRLNMTPPRREGDPSQTLRPHWDGVMLEQLKTPVKKPSGGVQGVLYLADATEEQGGFEYASGIYGDLDRWLDEHREDIIGGNDQPERASLSERLWKSLEMKPVPGKAGDLLIWDRLLVHGNGTNYAQTPRYAMYVSMNRAGGTFERTNARIKAWQTLDAPSYFPGDPRKWEQKHYGKPAELTPLGRKLLGLDPWE